MVRVGNREENRVARVETPKLMYVEKGPAVSGPRLEDMLTILDATTMNRRSEGRKGGRVGCEQCLSQSVF